MGKLFARLFMASLQLTLGLSWYFGFEDGVTLSTISYAVLMALIFFFSFITAFQVLHFDGGSLTDEGVKDLFKRCNEVDSVWFTVYTMTSAIISISLLFAAVSPVMAVIYFWLALSRVAVRHATLKRYKKHIANK